MLYSGKTTIMLRKIITRMILGVKADSNPRPLLLTASKVLCSAIKASMRKAITTLALQVKDDERTSLFLNNLKLSDVNDLSTELEASSFPVVITFKDLIVLVNNTLTNPFLPLQKKNAKEIDYFQFVSIYYPRFSEELRTIVESDTIYTEIMSHIKGSLDSVMNRGPLSLKQYLDLADSRQSKVDRYTREIIYDAYLRYEKMKEEKEAFDIEDVVGYLNEQFIQNKYNGVKFTDISIDEVQDLSPSQICLFKYLCECVSSGFIFAGITIYIYYQIFYMRAIFFFQQVILHRQLHMVLVLDFKL